MFFDERSRAESSRRADHVWTAPRSMAAKLLAAGGWCAAHGPPCRGAATPEGVPATWASPKRQPQGCSAATTQCITMQCFFSMSDYDEIIVDERLRAETSRRADNAKTSDEKMSTSDYEPRCHVERTTQKRPMKRCRRAITSRNVSSSGPCRCITMK